MLLPHLASRLLGTPLLIARAKLDVLLAVLGPRLGLPAIEAPLPVSIPRPAAEGPPGIALLPIHGTLVRRALGIEVLSGLTAYSEIAQQLDAAVADPGVHGIVLDIDSPGGEAGGVFELAERIRDAGAVKPVWAHVADAGFSAAYALAAAAQRITLTQTAGVGSIGVIALHVDQSARDAQQGLAYTAICAGAHKADFSPHAPLSAHAAAALQAEVDRLYGIFVDHVASCRGLSTAAVRATEAGLYFGEHAIAAGFADAVQPLDAVLAEFEQALSLGRRPPPNRLTSPSTAPSMELFMHDSIESPSAHPAHAATAANAAPSPPSAPPQPVSDAALDPVAAARQQAQRDAHAIAELCLIAGAPQRTAAFLAAGASEVEVRRALLEARADQVDIVSRIEPGVSTAAKPETSPLVAAAQHLARQGAAHDRTT